MYNTDFVCKYFIYDNNLKKTMTNYEDDKSVEEDLDLAEEKYRIEFLEIFGAKDICDDSVNDTIRDIYQKLKENQSMNEIFIKLAEKFFTQNPELGLIVGFCYDYLFLMHPCICDFLENGKISLENFNALKNSVENNIK